MSVLCVWGRKKNCYVHLLHFYRFSSMRRMPDFSSSTHRSQNGKRQNANELSCFRGLQTEPWHSLVVCLKGVIVNINARIPKSPFLLLMITAQLLVCEGKKWTKLQKKVKSQKIYVFHLNNFLVLLPSLRRVVDWSLYVKWMCNSPILIRRRRQKLGLDGTLREMRQLKKSMNDLRRWSKIKNSQNLIVKAANPSYSWYKNKHKKT